MVRLYQLELTEYSFRQETKNEERKQKKTQQTIRADTFSFKKIWIFDDEYCLQDSLARLAPLESSSPRPRVRNPIGRNHEIHFPR